MLRTLLKSKIHRARVTDASLDYEGSISIPKALMDSAGLVEYEQVHVWDVTNGQRLVTYAIVGFDSRICMNGAAAKCIHIGDIIIIAAFGLYSEDETYRCKTKVVRVDKNNKEINEKNIDKRPNITICSTCSFQERAI